MNINGSIPAPPPQVINAGEKKSNWTACKIVTVALMALASLVCAALVVGGVLALVGTFPLSLPLALGAVIVGGVGLAAIAAIAITMHYKSKSAEANQGNKPVVPNPTPAPINSIVSPVNSVVNPVIVLPASIVPPVNAAPTIPPSASAPPASSTSVTAPSAPTAPTPPSTAPANSTPVAAANPILTAPPGGPAVVVGSAPKVSKKLVAVADEAPARIVNASASAAGLTSPASVLGSIPVEHNETSLSSIFLTHYQVTKLRSIRVDVGELVRENDSNMRGTDWQNRLNEVVDEARWLNDELTTNHADSKLVVEFQSALRKAESLKALTQSLKKEHLGKKTKKSKIPAPNNTSMYSQCNKCISTLEEVLRLGDAAKLDAATVPAEKMLLNNLPVPTKLRLETLLNEAKTLSTCLKVIPVEHTQMLQAINEKDLERVLRHRDHLSKAFEMLPYKNFSESICKEWLQILDELEPIFDQIIILEEVAKILVHEERVKEKDNAKVYLQAIDVKLLHPLRDALQRELETGKRELHFSPGFLRNVPPPEDFAGQPEVTVDHGVPTAPVAPTAPTAIADLVKSAQPSLANAKPLKKTPVGAAQPDARLNVGILANAKAGLHHVSAPQKKAVELSVAEKRILTKFQAANAESDDDEDNGDAEEFDDGTSPDVDQSQRNAPAPAPKAPTNPKPKAPAPAAVKNPKPNVPAPDPFEALRLQVAHAKPAVKAPVVAADEEWDDNGSEVEVDVSAQPQPKQKAIGKVKTDGIAAKLGSLLGDRLNLINKGKSGKAPAVIKTAAKPQPQPKKLQLSAAHTALLSGLCTARS